MAHTQLVTPDPNKRIDWQPNIFLENLTAEHILELMEIMVAFVGERGGYMGGGFLPYHEEEGDDEQEETS